MKRSVSAAPGRRGFRVVSHRSGHRRRRAEVARTSEDASSPRVVVAVTDAAGRPIRAAGLGRWLEQAAPRRARGVVSVALVRDEQIRRWNRHYRGVDAVTDVLSFPAAGGPTAAMPRGVLPVLGDIAIATGQARRQARRLGHRYSDELRVLALHGLLHLLGYDHDRDDGRMAREERRLCRRAGLAAGLLDRS